jgi:hypothetical protein
MRNYIGILVLISFIFSASAQNNDDLYFRPSDKKTPDSYTSEKTPESYAPIVEKPYEEPPFYNNDDVNSTDATTNTYDGYQLREPGTSTSYSDGNTYITNNYYGDTYEDYNYTTRLRRFYNPSIGFGYYNNFYDPFWNDPFWRSSFGWGSGWNSGWGVSFGWGNPGFGWGWNNPNFGWGWGNAWSPYWGWGGAWNNPWGWGGGWGNPYWNGYNNGYWNGWNDVFFAGGGRWNSGGWYGNSGNSNGSYYGPRRTSGSATSTNNGVRGETVTSGPRIIRSEVPVTNNNDRTVTSPRNPNVGDRTNIKTPDTYSPRNNQGTYNTTPRNTSVEKASPSSPINRGTINSNNTPRNNTDRVVPVTPDNRNNSGNTTINENRGRITNDRDVAPPINRNTIERNNNNKKNIDKGIKTSPRINVEPKNNRQQFSSPSNNRNRIESAPMQRNSSPSINFSAPSNSGGGNNAPRNIGGGSGGSRGPR